VFKEGELLAFDSEAKLLAECEEYKKLYSTGVLT
jgi:ABC-type multidrug transport system fused ATPase/permease subunit